MVIDQLTIRLMANATSNSHLTKCDELNCGSEIPVVIITHLKSPLN